MTLPDATFSFGRHRGLPVSAVARSAPGYLLWVATIRPTRADARLWASVKAHLLQAAAMLEQRDLIEREELERRRARRLALETPPQGMAPQQPREENIGPCTLDGLRDSYQDSTTPEAKR